MISPMKWIARALRNPAVLLVVAVVIIGACSASDSSDDSAAEENSPTTTSAAVTPTTVAPTVEPTIVAPTTDAPTETTEAEAIVDPVVYADDFGSSIQPIFVNRCASCHNPGGPGTAHWVLETPADVVASGEFIQTVINTGYMPPWPSGPKSIAFRDERKLRDDELAAVNAWFDAGAALDVAEDTPMIIDRSDQQLSGLDVVLAADQPYQGSPTRTDDYRCQVYDPQITEPTWIRGYNFVPDQTEVVHHAIGYLVDGSRRDKAASESARDDAPGWECFGGSGIGQDELFIGWAPGQGPSEYPEGTGLLMEPGDFIVVQIHYHYEDSAPADLSTVELSYGDGDDYAEISIAEYVAPVEIPCRADESGPLCDRDAAMARAIERYGDDGVQADRFNFICGAKPADFAGMTDGIAASSCDLPIYSFGEIVSVLGHEHEIGKSFRMTLNPDSAEEKVLLDIPDWDFDWQYNYYPEESITLTPGDTVRIECSWDRDRRDPSLEPSYILWADGTNDEMCFSTIVTSGL